MRIPSEMSRAKKKRRRNNRYKPSGQILGMTLIEERQKMALSVKTLTREE
jgi:hypothetical protein